MQNIRNIINRSGQKLHSSGLRLSPAALTNCFKNEGVNLATSSTIGCARNAN
jgi:hypothetical protein